MERFFCTELLIGKDRLKVLHKSFVTLIGLGAVGSYAAEALARAGVGRLRLVDFDKIKATNFNRHLCALASTIGRPKVEAVRDRILEIHPACRVEALQMFAAGETMDAILDGKPDLVIDAIDSVNPKAQVLAACHQRKMPVISSMGAAVRTDILSIKTGDLFKTAGCPLAQRMRRSLRRQGIRKGIFCVYSDQPVLKSRVPAPELLNAEDDYDRGRKRRKLGSLPTVTGVFGLVVAHCAIGFLLTGKWGADLAKTLGH